MIMKLGNNYSKRINPQLTISQTKGEKMKEKKSNKLTGENKQHKEIKLTEIVNEVNKTSFTSFDQNWPTGSPSHKQLHDYNGVVGWLRPKKQ